MAYNNNIPQATDLISQSQSAILNNFAAIATVVEQDHEAFNSANEGKHKQAVFPVQAAAPTTGASEVGLYSKTSAVTGNSELVYVPESAGTEVEFTAATKATAGWAILPSGIMMKWGTGSVGNNSSATATYDSAKAFTTVYSAQVTMTGASGQDNKSLYLQSFNTTTLTVYNSCSSSGTQTFHYLVIGV